jgi:hypothetical protein
MAGAIFFQPLIDGFHHKKFYIQIIERLYKNNFFCKPAAIVLAQSKAFA